MSELKEYYIFIVSNHFLKSASIVLLSIVFAKFVDIVFTIVFRRVVDKTATKLDDKILHLLHKPIFYSILFIGFSLSVKIAPFPDYVDYAMTGIFKTITIVIWLFVVSKILLMSMEWASRKTKTNSLLQKNTVPLFNNLGKIAIGIFGAYFIFLSLDINRDGNTFKLINYEVIKKDLPENN